MSERPQDWVKEIAKRAAFFGWMSDANDITAKATAGRGDVWRAIGADRPLTRHRTQSGPSELLGPAWNDLERAYQIVGDASAGKWNAQTTSAVRKSIPFIQNHFLFPAPARSGRGRVQRISGVRPMNRHPQTWDGQ